MAGGRCYHRAVPRDSSLYDRVGPTALRVVITDFYRRLFDDLMIGFLFEGKDRLRLIERELEFTSRFLGGDVVYQGRTMREAHSKSPIFGGHFERRLQILRETLRDHAVDAEVQAAWIDHQLALRAQITGDAGSECKDTSVVAATAVAPDTIIRLGRRGS